MGAGECDERFFFCADRFSSGKLVFLTHYPLSNPRRLLLLYSPLGEPQISLEHKRHGIYSVAE
jgi:hypothetical protein